MKKERNLSKVIYVFVVLSLIYTCYVLFSSYSILSAYVSVGQATTQQMIESLISSSFIPFMITVILYALASMNDMFIQQFEKNQEKPVVETTEEKSEVKETKEEPEEIKEEEKVVSEEIQDKTEDNA